MSQLRAKYTQRRLVRLKITDVRCPRELPVMPDTHSSTDLGIGLLTGVLLGVMRRGWSRRR